MLIFNPIQDLHPRYAYTKPKIQWKQFKLSSGHQAPMTGHPGFIKKNVKKIGKNTNIEIQQNAAPTADGRTDGQGESSIPPLNFGVGGIPRELISFYIGWKIIIFVFMELSDNSFTINHSQIHANSLFSNSLTFDVWAGSVYSGTLNKLVSSQTI